MAKKNKIFRSMAPDCYACLINQTHAAIRFANLSDEQAQRVIRVTETALEEAKTKPLLAQHIVRRVADKIIQELGEAPEFDIYADVKEKSNQLSLKYAQHFQEKIDVSEMPFETGLQIAAAGNIIDFGARNDGSFDLDKELQALDKTAFKHYDIDLFSEKLSKALTLLYLCDNSGEIVFDGLFMKEIMRKYPRIQIIAAFRDKPIINDATLKDAKDVGLDKLVKCISSGSLFPGTILSETTKEFQRLFASADVMLSKGQGNYETLLPEANERLFFLLRIKCEYMASLSKVENGSLVLINGQKLSGA